MVRTLPGPRLAAACRGAVRDGRRRPRRLWGQISWVRSRNRRDPGRGERAERRVQGRGDGRRPYARSRHRHKPWPVHGEHAHARDALHADASQPLSPRQDHERRYLKGREASGCVEDHPSREPPRRVRGRLPRCRQSNTLPLQRGSVRSRLADRGRRRGERAHRRCRHATDRRPVPGPSCGP